MKFNLENPINSPHDAEVEFTYWVWDQVWSSGKISVDLSQHGQHHLDVAIQINNNILSKFNMLDPEHDGTNVSWALGVSKDKIKDTLACLFSEVEDDYDDLTEEWAEIKEADFNNVLIACVDEAAAGSVAIIAVQSRFID